MVRPENLVTPKNHVGKCHRLLFNFQASCQLHGGIAATQLTCSARQHAAERVYHLIEIITTVLALTQILLAPDGIRFGAACS